MAVGGGDTQELHISNCSILRYLDFHRSSHLKVKVFNCPNLYLLTLSNANITFSNCPAIGSVTLKVPFDLRPFTSLTELITVPPTSWRLSDSQTNVGTLYVNSDTHWEHLNIENCTHWASNPLHGRLVSLDSTSLNSAPRLHFESAEVACTENKLLDLRKVRTRKLVRLYKSVGAIILYHPQSLHYRMDVLKTPAYNCCLYTRRSSAPKVNLIKILPSLLLGLFLFK